MTVASSGVHLVLFVASDSPPTLAARTLLHHALLMRRDEMFVLEVVDVAVDPDRALAEHVLVTPTLLAPDLGQRLVTGLRDPDQLALFLRALATAREHQPNFILN
jgi:hypothetical protein